MLKIVPIIVACGLLAGCQTTDTGNNQTTGAVLGGIAGGVLGSTVGGGSGRLVATGAGVLLGAMAGSAVGQSMDQPKQQVIVQQASPVGECSHIQNAGVRSSCERGVSERNADAQRQAEQSAYRCARYGRC
jgi:uncharacterized protein YcfJ